MRRVGVRNARDLMLDDMRELTALINDATSRDALHALDAYDAGVLESRLRDAHASLLNMRVRLRALIVGLDDTSCAGGAS